MKKHIELIYTIILILFTTYVILDTFVIEKSYKVVEQEKTNSITSNNVTKTDTSYKDDNIEANLTEYYENNTKIYVVDVSLKDTSLLKTAFAKSSYGKNVTEKTSTIADSVGAILAINGDYYGVQETGYVLKKWNNI